MIEPNTKEADRLIRNMERITEHPWAAIEEGWVWTLDEVDLRSPIKQFPNESWLREVTEIWFKESLTAWPKSRRMKMSWVMVWNHLWLAAFHEGAKVAFQSETEKKSNILIQRAEFIYKHLPQQELLLPKLKGGRAMWCSMEWPGLYSKIEGFAEGANQLRGDTFTGVLADEIAFWPKGRASLGGFKPTTEGGGKVTLVSSALAGFWRDLCYDELDGGDRR
jgi:hypothetical protein